jgi:hypothetical protein
MFSFSTFSFCWVLEVVTTVMTSPYHFYFIFVPRVASNWKKVKFGEVAVPKQISMPHCTNSWKFPERCFSFVISYAHDPGYYLTFISFALFDLTNRRFSKKLIFTSCSVLIDFCHYLHLPLDLFLVEFFWSWNFWEKLLQYLMC